jgi:sigma-B regulation protein RsbU (phosphoserine phosphatase)
VYQQDQLLISWPTGQRVPEPSLTEHILLGDAIVGEIRVSGVSGLATQTRLRSDAQLISHLIQLEDELKSMTADLVTSHDQQLALYRLTQLMRDHVTIAESLQAVLTEAIRMVRARGGFAVFVPASGMDPILLQHPEAFLPTKTAWQLYWQVQSLERELRIPEHAEPHSVAATIDNMVVLPIWVRGSIMAGLGLINRPDGFAAPDLKLAKAVVSQASAQIERLLLYQEMYSQAQLRTEMDLARRVQLDLLPRQLPRVPGIDIFAATRPAYEVGGDFYDFIVADERPFVFALGDVTGKGLSAALLMTMTRTAIHSKAQFMPFPTPEAIMRQSNEDLYNDFTRVGVFATAFVGQYTPGSQQLIYSNAGHAPVIYRPYDGEAVLLRADSTAIGILPVSHCRNQSVAMRPNDVLLVATDGFSDARNPQDDMFDIERLIQQVDSLAHRSARDIAGALYSQVEQFGEGRPQDDDQTLVVIKGVEQ